MARSTVEPSAVASPQLAEARRAEFERRFQRLVTAMNAFSAKYNQAKGELWPLKEAQSIERAIRDLKDVEPSFESAKRP